MPYNITTLIELPNGTRTTVCIPDRKVKTEAEILEWVKGNTKIIRRDER